MNIKLIKNEENYKKAMERLATIFDAEDGTKELDELGVLLLLIDEYEKEQFEIEAPDPIEAIKFRMDQMGRLPKDLGKVLGYKSRASEVLKRKRKLTIKMIRNINQMLDIPLHVLVQEYQLSK